MGCSMEIVPYIGIGDFKFGDVRSNVREKCPVTVQLATKEVVNSQIDVYDALGLHLYYNNDDHLVFIKCFAPCNPVFVGLQLTKLSLQGALTAMKESGYDYQYSDPVYNYDGGGFALSASATELISLLLYSAGYYDITFKACGIAI